MLEKAEVEEKSIESSQETIKGETLPRPGQPSNDQIHESLRIIKEETLKLSEFVLQEEKLIEELCVLLKQILKCLDMSFSLPTDIFPQTGETQRIILNDEAHLLFISEENEEKSIALDDCPPQVILKVVLFIIPELSRSITSYRKKISSRIGLFDKIKGDLANLRNIFANLPKKLEEDKESG